MLPLLQLLLPEVAANHRVAMLITSAVEAETDSDPFTASRPSQFSTEWESSSALQSGNPADAFLEIR